MSDFEFDDQVKTREKPGVRVQEPDQYRVILHNDDYTTMDFVVEVIVTVFNKNVLTAARLMLDVHRKGSAHVGTYTFDIAKTKVAQVKEMAAAREFPLRCTMEKA